MPISSSDSIYSSEELNEPEKGSDLSGLMMAMFFFRARDLVSDRLSRKPSDLSTSEKLGVIASMQAFQA